MNDILGAKNDMLDVIGITQHHDAVSGTGQQAVADDYVWKLFKGQRHNSFEYSKQISEKIKKNTGHESQHEWT